MEHPFSKKYETQIKDITKNADPQCNEIMSNVYNKFLYEFAISKKSSSLSSRTSQWENSNFS